ncbi:MAG: hypothetical protein VCD00_01180 [Candidatus Hydrogenedentota bacterium]
MPRKYTTDKLEIFNSIVRKYDLVRPPQFCEGGMAFAPLIEDVPITAPDTTDEFELEAPANP